MADEAGMAWRAGITRAVRVLCLFVGGVAGVISCAAGRIDGIDRSTLIRQLIQDGITARGKK